MNIESLLKKNPDVRYMGIVHKVNRRETTARVFSYVLISDHAAIPHSKSLKDIESEIFSNGYKTLDDNRRAYRQEAIDWLTDWMTENADGKATRTEITDFLDGLERDGALRIDAHEVFKDMQVTAHFRFNAYNMKVTSVYDPYEKSGFFGWTNTHTIRIANLTDNRYMTVKLNPKLESHLPNGKLNPNPDKLAFVTTPDELKQVFACIVEFGRLWELGYDGFLSETCKSDDREARLWYKEAERVFVGLNRVCGIRSYEHAGRLLSNGIE